MIRYLIIIYILFLSLADVWAAPIIGGVSGTISDGSTVTISSNASNFGSHDLDIEWVGGSDGLIETSTTGQTPSNTRGWIFNQGVYGNQVVSETQAHSGNKSLYCDTTSAIRYDYGANIQPGETVYISWWIRTNLAGTASTTYPYGQHKLFRLNWQNDIQDDYPQIVMFNWYNANQLYIRPGNTVEANVTADYPSYPSQNDRWYRLEYILTESTIGTSDGESVFVRHDPNVSISSSTESNVMTYYDGNRLHRWFLWQNYLGNGITSRNVWTDDIYVQVGSQARVELGDSSTWSNCTFREIQYPTSWSTTSISIKFNKGSFATNDTAYLYVIDSNGDYNSSGYEITIGGTTQPDPPAETSHGQLSNNGGGRILASDAGSLTVAE